MPQIHTAASTEKEYECGHSDRELKRLATQAQLIDPVTRRFFVDAGLKPGMRLLDVGSGAWGSETAMSPIMPIPPDSSPPLPVSALNPIVEQSGVANVAGLMPETITERMRANVLANRSVVFGRYEAGAWAKVG